MVGMMRNRTFTKDIFRSITHSWSRFWAIFAIVALGAGFFAGLRSTSPDMQATGDSYYDQCNLMDIELLSTLGFTDEDITAVSNTSGAKDVMAVHRADILSKINGEKQVIRIHGIPDDWNRGNGDYMNRPIVTSGRMPERPGECVVGMGRLLNFDSLKLGSIITLEDTDGELSDTIKYRYYTIVGFVNSAYYISFTLGNTTIGNGTISYFMYIPDSDFAQEVYTDVFVTVEGARKISSFSAEYKGSVGRVSDEFDALADEREKIRYDDIYSEAEGKIADAQKDYDDAKEDADKKLADARKELDDGRKEIGDNEKKLKDAKTR